ncbi:MAG: fumarylacetoacetase [Proteobacteria bacterium]|nr:fumarylacetoacetase [Pseudomonadota bacterium]
MLQSFLPIPSHSDFPLGNIPFGSVTRSGGVEVCASRIGDQVIDLSALQQLGYFDALDLPNGLFNQSLLNDFIAMGQPTWRAVRSRLQALFSAGSALEGSNHMHEIVLALTDVDVNLPIHIPDYTDFYSSIEHATNVGTMFRDPNNALLPNWLHIPVGYHGRSSTIMPSGTPIHRPNGQRKAPSDDKPTFGPSIKVDFELEIAFITGSGPTGGSSIAVDQAESHIFGLTLFNDWSARDIQQWEYVPLGPFLAKNFASSMSPWIVTLDALAPFRTPAPSQDDVQPLPYLQQDRSACNLDIQLDVSITPEKGQATQVSTSNFKYMYWSMAQQLAHHSINGCLIQAGDTMASGTISGKDKGSYGSMLELSWNGTEPIVMKGGGQRSFIEDGDTVTMTGHAEKAGLRIGFGEVSAKLLPAQPWNDLTTKK